MGRDEKRRLSRTKSKFGLANTTAIKERRNGPFSRTKNITGYRATTFAQLDGHNLGARGGEIPPRDSTAPPVRLHTQTWREKPLISRLAVVELIAATTAAPRSCS
jgi:hypothetical protein